MTSKRIKNKFSELIEINPYRTLSKDSEAPFIAMEDLQPFTRDIHVIKKRASNGSGSRFRNGDTLLARITPSLENGKTIYINNLPENVVAHGSTEFIVLSGKTGITHNEFVYYFARDPDFRSFAIKSMTGTSGRQRVQPNSLASLDISIPSLNDQKAIASILGSIDDKIFLNSQMNQTLENLLHCLFRYWFVCFEFPDKDGNLYRSSGGSFTQSRAGKIPNNWKVESLDTIADFLNGLALQRFPPTDNKFLPVVKIRELRNGITTNTGKASAYIESKYIVDNGDVLFSWSGTLDVDIWCNGKGALNQHLFKVTSKTYPKWFYLEWTKFHLEDFQRIAAGKATTMGHIQRHHLSDALVLVPNEEELSSMNNIMIPLLDKIIMNRIESRTLSCIRDILLPKLIHGNIIIIHPNIFERRIRK